MSSRIETNQRPIYTVPGLIEMEKDFDQVIITGSYSAATFLNARIVSRLRDEITDYGEKDLSELYNGYILSQLQASDLFANTTKYISTKKGFQLEFSKDARAELVKITNRTLADQVEKILNIIESQLQPYDFLTIPPIYVDELENGSILIEWAFDNVRLGFNIENQISNSGYFLASNHLAGEIRNSGYLFRGLRLGTIIHSLISLLLDDLINHERIS